MVMLDSAVASLFAQVYENGWQCCENTGRMHQKKISLTLQKSKNFGQNSKLGQSTDYFKAAAELLREEMTRGGPFLPVW